MPPFTLRRRALTRRAGRPNFSRAFSCNVSTAEIERDGIKAAGEDDARAGSFRLFVMGVDHAPHPSRFAAQINIGRARATQAATSSGP